MHSVQTLVGATPTPEGKSTDLLMFGITVVTAVVPIHLGPFISYTCHTLVTYLVSTMEFTAAFPPSTIDVT